eukprot:gb/GEZN01000136.1/.p1 GENE.gb/GEZN01000136.1/~~gb/GEZN01000136.1/.p1  ORF type:complete len:2036 (+),score=255.70 gb/GEZN01000136.1/:46-6108(+)
MGLQACLSKCGSLLVLFVFTSLPIVTGVVTLKVAKPPSLAELYPNGVGFTAALFGPPVYLQTFTNNFFYPRTPNNRVGCTPLNISTEPDWPSGTPFFLLLDRGACPFVTKARNAQQAGATVVSIMNNAPGMILMADDGTGADITVPAIFILQSDGILIKTALAQEEVAASLQASALDSDENYQAAFRSTGCHNQAIVANASWRTVSDSEAFSSMYSTCRAAAAGVIAQRDLCCGVGSNCVPGCFLQSRWPGVYRLTLQAVGCPNSDNVAASWWPAAADSAVWGSMYSSCVATKSGTPTAAQRNVCCGTGRACVPTVCDMPTRWVTDCRNYRKDPLETGLDCGGPFCSLCTEALFFDDAQDAARSAVVWNFENAVPNGMPWRVANNSATGAGGVLLAQQIANQRSNCTITMATPVRGLRFMSFLACLNSTSNGAFVQLKVGTAEWANIGVLPSNNLWQIYTYEHDFPYPDANSTQGDKVEEFISVRFMFLSPALPAGTVGPRGWFLDDVRIMGPCPAGKGLNLARTACIPCPDFFFSPVTLAYCQACPQFHVPTVSGDACVACSRNSIVTTNGCQACPAGQERDASGTRCYIPTCTDGIENGNEVATDCGGSCPPCVIFQRLLFDDAETNNTSLQVFMDGPVTGRWNKVIDRAHSPARAWFAQDLPGPDDTYSKLRTPLLERVVKLSVWMNYDTESNDNIQVEPWDGLWLQYRREDLVTWQSFSLFKLGGNSGGWVKKEYDFSKRLHPLARYQFQFVFFCDESVGAPQYAGFWLDDIEFVSGSCLAGLGIASANSSLSSGFAPHCLPCPPAQYSPEGSLLCHLCEGRNEVPNANQSSCVACGANEIVVNGVTCQRCSGELVPDPTHQICILPTCTDGFQNGNEQDTDCGSPCPACSIPLLQDGMATSNNWVVSSGWTRLNPPNDAHSGDSLFTTAAVPLPSGPEKLQHILTLVPSFQDATRMSFWQKYKLQDCCSRGFVEFSTDNKVTWRNLALFRKPLQFLQFRWTIFSSRGGQAISIPEIKLYANGVAIDLTIRPSVSNVIVTTSSGGNSGIALTDGRTDNAWTAPLNYLQGDSGVYIDIKFTSSTGVSEYEFWNPQRANEDPSSWQWAGSNDGVRWEQLERVYENSAVPAEVVRPSSAGRRPINPYRSGDSDGWQHVDINLRSLPPGLSTHFRWRLEHQATQEFYPDIPNQGWGIDDLRIFGPCGAGLALTPAGTACVPCPTNAVSLPGSPTCTVCNATMGLLPNSEKTTCLSCAQNEEVQTQGGVPVCSVCTGTNLRLFTGRCGPNPCTLTPLVCPESSVCIFQTQAPGYGCCPSGYLFRPSSNSSTVCFEIDECSASPSPCSPHASCANTDGSFLCTCQEGFGGDGQVCVMESCSNNIKDATEEGVDCGAVCHNICAGTLLWDDVESNQVAWLNWTDPAGDQVFWKREKGLAWSFSKAFHIPKATSPASASLISPALAFPRALSFRHLFDADTPLAGGSVEVLQVQIQNQDMDQQTLKTLAESRDWIKLQVFNTPMNPLSWAYYYKRLDIPLVNATTGAPLLYRFRFHMTSASGSNGKGWLLDDIRVLGGEQGACLPGAGSRTGAGSGLCEPCPPSWISAATLDCSYCDFANDGLVPNAERTACVDTRSTTTTTTSTTAIPTTTTTITTPITTTTATTTTIPTTTTTITPDSTTTTIPTTTTTITATTTPTNTTATTTTPAITTTTTTPTTTTATTTTTTNTTATTTATPASTTTTTSPLVVCPGLDCAAAAGHGKCLIGACLCFDGHHGENCEFPPPTGTEVITCPAPFRVGWATSEQAKYFCIPSAPPCFPPTEEQEGLCIVPSSLKASDGCPPPLQPVGPVCQIPEPMKVQQQSALEVSETKRKSKWWIAIIVLLCLGIGGCVYCVTCKKGPARVGVLSHQQLHEAEVEVEAPVHVLPDSHRELHEAEDNVETPLRIEPQVSGLHSEEFQPGAPEDEHADLETDRVSVLLIPDGSSQSVDGSSQSVGSHPHVTITDEAAHYMFGVNTEKNRVD